MSATRRYDVESADYVEEKGDGDCSFQYSHHVSCFNIPIQLWTY